MDRSFQCNDPQCPVCHPERARMQMPQPAPAFPDDYAIRTRPDAMRTTQRAYAPRDAASVLRDYPPMPGTTYRLTVEPAVVTPLSPEEEAEVRRKRRVQVRRLDLTETVRQSKAWRDGTPDQRERMLENVRDLIAFERRNGLIPGVEARPYTTPDPEAEPEKTTRAQPCDHQWDPIAVRPGYGDYERVHQRCALCSCERYVTRTPVITPARGGRVRTTYEEHFAEAMLATYENIMARRRAMQANEPVIIEGPAQQPE